MIYAIDCDLRKTYCRSASGETMFSAAPTVNGVLDFLEAGDTLLFEIASPVDYSDSKSIAHNKRRWTIWNISQAAFLHHSLQGSINLLVSPSNAWTKGFDLDVRTKLSGTTAKNKDLRECDNMIWFFKHHPVAWIQYAYFMYNL